LAGWGAQDSGEDSEYQFPVRLPNSYETMNRWTHITKRDQGLSQRSHPHPTQCGWGTCTCEGAVIWIWLLPPVPFADGQWGRLVFGTEALLEW
jgi:hypothetical protein